MKITKEILQARIASMEQRMGVLMGQAAQVQGGIASCQELLRLLEAPEPEPEPDPEGEACEDEDEEPTPVEGED